jgi:hypothetical protein
MPASPPVTGWAPLPFAAPLSFTASVGFRVPTVHEAGTAPAVAAAVWMARVCAQPRCRNMQPSRSVHHCGPGAQAGLHHLPPLGARHTPASPWQWAVGTQVLPLARHPTPSSTPGHGRSTMHLQRRGKLSLGAPVGWRDTRVQGWWEPEVTVARSVCLGYACRRP